MNTRVPQCFRWRLDGRTLPPVARALSVCEALRTAVFRRAEARFFWPLPDAFHGGANGDHSHAHWLSEDEDDDGLIDHVLVFAEHGLPEPLIPALAEGARLSIDPGGPAWRIAPSWMGARAPGALFGPATRWRSFTPFVTPQQIRRQGGKRYPARGVEAQLRKELERRRLPPASIQWISFARKGFDGSPQSTKERGGADAGHAELVFDEPVWGPVVLGYKSHFGLGHFLPVADDGDFARDDFDF